MTQSRQVARLVFTRTGGASHRPDSRAIGPHGRACRGFLLERCDNQTSASEEPLLWLTTGP